MFKKHKTYKRHCWSFISIPEETKQNQMQQVVDAMNKQRTAPPCFGSRSLVKEYLANNPLKEKDAKKRILVRISGFECVVGFQDAPSSRYIKLKDPVKVNKQWSNNVKRFFLSSYLPSTSKSIPDKLISFATDEEELSDYREYCRTDSYKQQITKFINTIKSDDSALKNYRNIFKLLRHIHATNDIKTLAQEHNIFDKAVKIASNFTSKNPLYKVVLDSLKVTLLASKLKYIPPNKPNTLSDDPQFKPFEKSLDKFQLKNFQNSQSNPPDRISLNLAGADLSYQFLCDLNFSYAYMRNANLRHSFLGGANFKMTDLSEGDLTGTYSSGGAQFDSTILHNTNLRESWLMYSKCKNSDFSKANCEGTDFSGTQFINTNLNDIKIDCRTGVEKNLMYNYTYLKCNDNSPKLTDDHKKGLYLLGNDSRIWLIIRTRRNKDTYDITCKLNEVLNIEDLLIIQEKINAVSKDGKLELGGEIVHKIALHNQIDPAKIDAKTLKSLFSSKRPDVAFILKCLRCCSKADFKKVITEIVKGEDNSALKSLSQVVTKGGDTPIRSCLFAILLEMQERGERLPLSNCKSISHGCRNALCDELCKRAKPTCNTDLLKSLLKTEDGGTVKKSTSLVSKGPPSTKQPLTRIFYTDAPGSFLSSKIPSAFLMYIDNSNVAIEKIKGVLKELENKLSNSEVEMGDSRSELNVFYMAALTHESNFIH